MIFRNKTNVTLIIDGDDNDIYFELSSEQQMIIAIGSAVVFVILLILMLHFCCWGDKGRDEKNEATHSQRIELETQSTDTEEEKEVDNKESSKTIGVLKVKKNFQKLIV